MIDDVHLHKDSTRFFWMYAEDRMPITIVYEWLTISIYVMIPDLFLMDTDDQMPIAIISQWLTTSI